MDRDMLWWDSELPALLPQKLDQETKTPFLKRKKSKEKGLHHRPLNWKTQGREQQ